MVKEEFHIDMSNKFHNEVNVGIACCNFDKTNHIGCSLNGNLVKKLHHEFCNSKKNDGDENAKLYATVIYCLIKDMLQDIKRLVICCDENPELTKIHLTDLLKDIPKIEIISIKEYRLAIGDPKFKSKAHNLCNSYRKRSAKRWMWKKGIPLNVIEIRFNELKKILKNGASNQSSRTNPLGQ